MKAPARKSRRKRTQRDYANLNSGLDTDPARWTRMLTGKALKEDNFKRMNGSDVNLQWLEDDPCAMEEPIVVEQPSGLGRYLYRLSGKWSKSDIPLVVFQG